MIMLEAIAEMNRLKDLQDGNEYCIVMSHEGDWRVEQKTSYHYMIDNQDIELSNTKVTDIEFI